MSHGSMLDIRLYGLSVFTTAAVLCAMWIVGEMPAREPLHRRALLSATRFTSSQQRFVQYVLDKCFIFGSPSATVRKELRGARTNAEDSSGRHCRRSGEAAGGWAGGWGGRTRGGNYNEIKKQKRPFRFYAGKEGMAIWDVACWREGGKRLGRNPPCTRITFELES